ncbi:uncharacterized protein LOC143041611 [Oratosquilla oratoria]|uniref:uncharacterized protein LOC143041611 n=1 Tax=Oratosquilla oratoria TaxID=337810 RepID=UPI003F76943C
MPRIGKHVRPGALPMYKNNAIKYCNRFIPKCSFVLQPLYSLIRPCKRGQSLKLAWCPEADEAFASAKTALATVDTLSFPAPEALISIATDASNDRIGAVNNNTSLVLGSRSPSFPRNRARLRRTTAYSIGSCLLSTGQSNDSGISLKVNSSSSSQTINPSPPPSTLTNPAIPPLSSATYSTFLSAPQIFTTSKVLTPADALSRYINSVSSQSPVTDYTAITAAQAKCDDLQRLLNIPSLKMDKIQVPGTDIRLYADVFTGNLRPFIPTLFRHQLFHHLHDLAHPGQASTRTSGTGPAPAFSARSPRFSHIHVDIVGTLPYPNGYKYVFICVDTFTRWPEAITLPDIKTDTIARAFVDN